MIFRKSLVLVATMVLLVFKPTSVWTKRGPHHPRGELGKVNEHIVHSDEHLKADLSASHIRPEKPVEEMSEEEKQFYHFKMHDYDNNNLLDGLEILQSANEHDNTFHGHSKQNPTDNGSEELGLQHLVEIIDDFLLVADKNNDGYLNFNEYKDSLRGTNAHELGAAVEHPDEEDDAINNNKL